LGICFTLAYEWSGCWLVSMTMHAVFTAITLLALAFPDILPPSRGCCANSAKTNCWQRFFPGLLVIHGSCLGTGTIARWADSGPAFEVCRASRRSALVDGKFQSARHDGPERWPWHGLAPAGAREQTWFLH